MQHLVDPKQSYLFEPLAEMFSDVAAKRVRNGWQGLFRHAILELMPADCLADSFHESMGRPTKELYSMAGLLFIMEFNDWTAQETADAYMFRMDVHYALNLGPCAQSMTSRTIERYRRLFRENDIAHVIVRDVTERLVWLLELDIEKQRLDSTHIYSNMALFGRTRLMGITVRRFLHQVRRHTRECYDALPEELRKRYGQSEARLFGDTRKNADARRLLREQIANDMLYLIQRFENDNRLNNRTSFKNLLRVFEEQCEVAEDAVQVRKKIDCRCLQNPSDPDATYDGYKGSGYQAQIAETCSEKNAVQLITDVIVQTAAAADSDTMAEVIENLEKADRKPERLLADTAYGSDENVRHCASQGVELVAPVCERRASHQNKHTVADFDIDPQTHQVRCCPAGHCPRSTSYNARSDKGRATFPESTCAVCTQLEHCPVEKHSRHYRFTYTTREQRTEARRRHQKTDAFRKAYAKRAGIEGTNSALKRKTGFGRLRVRGMPAVSMALLLKVAGYNLLQASRSCKLLTRVATQMAQPFNAAQSMISRLRCALHRPFRTRPLIPAATGIYSRLTTPRHTNRLYA